MKRINDVDAVYCISVVLAVVAVVGVFAALVGGHYG